MKYFFLLVAFFTLSDLNAQFSDNFTDADFSANPTWIGDDSVFTVVDQSGNMRLRSNKTMLNSSFYLSTASNSSQDTQWEWYTNLLFSTSGANYVDVYLTANQSNLLSPTLSGYFVRIGGTDDEICLFKRVTGTATKIIDGTNNLTNSSNNSIKIKVVCTAAGEWRLDHDLTGTGDSYFTEPIVTDVSVTGSSFFGVSITQSTGSFILKHYFDDFYVGPIIYDLTPPELVSATPVNSNQIDILFNEALDEISAETLTNYDILPFQSATTAVLDAVNAALVHITLSSPLTNGNVYTVNTTSIADVALNISSSQSVQFTYLVSETPSVGDVIINEFMADPSPIIGLPEAEYIEIFNRSGKYFDLQGWKIGDASSDGTIQQSWLYPGEYKILCATSFVDSFLNTVAVTSFPSLNNANDVIVLKSSTGLVLDQLNFTDDWYQDDVKKAGGYSLELINPNDPCSDQDNWIASNSSTGGTPALINSIFNNTPDTQFPQISELIATAPNTLEIFFTEGMDSTSLANATFVLSPTLTVSANYVLTAHPHNILMQFNEAIIPSQIYEITLQAVGDCWLNTTNLSGQFILPEAPEKGDLILNEILFDPYSGGSDWIEIYNNSEKVIDLKNWQIANYDDTIANHKTVNQHYLLSPNQYVVLGKDSNFVKTNYPYSIPGTFLYSELPSLNIDSSTVYIIYNGLVMDKVSYTDDWHFQLLDDTDGISLERIDINGNSDDINNWHSAAKAIGFATPGGQNSQFYPALENGEFNFTSSTFSPDNDGYEDILQVNYSMTKPGLLGTFTIYDDRGRKVIELFSNELLATKGTFKWDGLTEENTKATIGTYVAVFEAFDVNGGLTFTKRKAFVIAGMI